MSQLTIKDSRFPRLYCQDETRPTEAAQEKEHGEGQSELQAEIHSEAHGEVHGEAHGEVQSEGNGETHAPERSE
jgi:hypothetical protein